MHLAGLHQTFVFFSKPCVLALLRNQSAQRQCFLSVVPNRRRGSLWGEVEGVKEKTGSLGQEVAFTDKGAGQEQQETGTVTEEDLALMCRQKIRRL